MNLLHLTVIVLGTARITRLITTDTIAEPLIDRLVFGIGRRNPTAGEWVNSLLTCPWCIGWWLSVAVVLTYAQTPTVTTWLLAPWALSYAVGTLEMWNDR